MNLKQEVQLLAADSTDRTSFPKGKAQPWLPTGMSCSVPNIKELQDT